MSKSISILFVVLALLLTFLGGAWFLRDDRLTIERESGVAAHDLEADAALPSRSGTERSADGPVPSTEIDVEGERRSESKAVEGQGAGVRVRVISKEDGTPVAGLQVFAYRPDDFPVRTANLGLTHDEVVRRYARSHRSDERGEIRVMESAKTLHLLVFDDEYEGQAYIRRGKTEVSLVVERYRSVAVHVVDLEGRPMADVPVELRFDESGHLDALWQGRTRAPDGDLRVPILGRFAGNPNLKLVVGLRGLLDEEVEAPADPDAGPITLIVPPCGSLNIQVQDAEGRPLEGAIEFGVSVQLAPTDKSENGSRRTRLAPLAMTEGGRALIPLVGLGRLYRVTLIPEVDVVYTTLNQDIEGPRDAGETVEVVFRLPEEPTRCLVRGRALREDGSVMAQTVLQLRSSRHKVPELGSSGRSLTTDEDGRFELPLDIPAPSGASAWWLQFEHEVEENVKARIDVDLGAGKPDPHDLGDLRFEVDGILLAGRVIDAAGDPVARALVFARPKRGPEDGAIIERLAESTRITGADGRFSYQGRTDATELQVSVSGGGGPCHETFRCGSVGIELRLPARAILRAQLAVEGDDPGRFEAFVYRLSQVDGFPGTASGESGLQGAIEAVREPGRYRFQIFHRLDLETPVYQRESLVLESRQPLDLGVIALKSPGVRVELTVETPEKDREPRFGCRMRLFEPGTELLIREEAVAILARPLVLFVEKLPFDVELEVEPFRSVRKRIETKAETITFTRPGLDVRIEVRGLDELPAQARGFVVIRQGEGGPDDFPDTRHPVHAKEAVISQPLPRTGFYELEFWVSSPQPDWSVVQVCINRDSPLRFEVEESEETQLVVFQLSSADLERCRAEIEKKR